MSCRVFGGVDKGSASPAAALLRGNCCFRNNSSKRMKNNVFSRALPRHEGVLVIVKSSSATDPPLQVVSNSKDTSPMSDSEPHGPVLDFNSVPLRAMFAPVVVLLPVIPIGRLKQGNQCLNIGRSHRTGRLIRGLVQRFNAFALLRVL